MEESPDAPEPPLSVQDQRGSELDLFVRHNPGQLQKIPDLRAKIESILASLDSYSTAIDEGKGIARHLNVPLLGSRLEDIIGGSFSSSCPRIVETNGPMNDYGVTPGWVDLIRDARPGQFEPHGNEMFHYRTQGLTIEMNKHDREAVCSPVFRKIFCSGPLPEDLKAEQETITALLGDMSELGKDMIQAFAKIQHVVKQLKDYSSNLSDSTGIAPSPLSLWEFGGEENCTLPIDGPQTPPPDTRLVQTQQITPHGAPAASERVTICTNTGGPGVLPSQPRHRWTRAEKTAYADFMRGRCHMSWPRIADDYWKTTGNRLSVNSLRQQAKRMGIQVECGMPEKPSKLSRSSRSSPLVLKVNFPPHSGKPAKNDQQPNSIGIMQYGDDGVGDRPEASQTHGHNTEPKYSAPNSPYSPQDIPISNDMRNLQSQGSGQDSAGQLNWILN
ncbi:hypothetical protein N7522_001885 [Penicillium canescens]|uniref:uncharacterized protein n=1 Tax=Penicillium canescens TaxID=5083 RepID=UPI0026E06FDE|nr:uncharacterized protein N7446_012684 [Penicillium canescens]KAJ6018421.1 hypothetical protein N7522_001885 [Penicillium canescens]KAJ6045820.1 hypothetical protein N7446_012684 [Penicillium canescens]KAJ6175296.1 hypothetical protein N7485_005101 [Penicillium canescens]